MATAAAIGTISAIASVAGTATTIVGSVMQARAQKQAGAAAQAAANYEASQLDMSAKEEVAAGQRESIETRRQKDLLLSRARAVAAAGTGSASDVSTVDALADIEREGTYRSSLAMYGGIQRAKGTRAQAEATRRSGQAAATGALMAARGTIIGGIGSAFNQASSFFLNYGGGQPGGAGGGVPFYGTP